MLREVFVDKIMNYFTLNFSKDINKHIDMTQVLFINNNNDKKFFEFLIMYFKQISKYKLKFFLFEYFNGISIHYD